MRSSVFVSAVLLAQLTLASQALAQETPTGGSPPVSGTVPPVAPPPVTATTTTTQATLDGPLAAPVVAPAPVTESGGSESTTYVNRPLLVSGLVLFGGTFAASAGVAAESDRPSDNPNLYYPVVGPWMDLAQRDCTALRPCVGEPGNKALLILDGVGQGVGALAILTSFFVPEKKSRHWFFVGTEKVHAAPATVGTGYGLAAVGRF